MRKAVARGIVAIRPSRDPVNQFIAETTPGARLFEFGVGEPPLSSFNFGAAGIAFAFYRIARARTDSDLIAAAELWQDRAEAALRFTRPSMGRVSSARKISERPRHITASGVWLTRAFIAWAIGSVSGIECAVRRYTDAVADAKNCSELDLTLGASSAVLGAALLYRIHPNLVLRKLGDAIAASISDRLDSEPAIRECKRFRYLGMAHGWAGHVYALLLWPTRRPLRLPPVPSAGWTNSSNQTTVPAQ